MKSALKIFLITLLILTATAYARVDYRTYTDDVDVLAVWINPKNIKVYVEESNKSYVLKNAFKAWDSAMRSNMDFTFVKNKNDADITIGYIDSLGKTKVGETRTGHVNIQGKIYLQKAQILIARKDQWGFIMNDAELLKISLHEIGHAIGILGHSESMNDIMYYSTASTKNTSPSLRDIETVNKLYGF